MQGETPGRAAPRRAKRGLRWSSARAYRASSLHEGEVQAEGALRNVSKRCEERTCQAGTAPHAPRGTNLILINILGPLGNLLDVDQIAYRRGLRIVRCGWPVAHAQTGHAAAALRKNLRLGLRAAIEAVRGLRQPFPSRMVRITLRLRARSAPP